MNTIRLSCVISISMLLAGCATTQRPVRYQYPSYPAKPSEEPAAAAVPDSPGVKAATTYHKVKPGETLWSISKMYNVDMNAVARANSIEDCGSITKGEVLTIPSGQNARPGYAVRGAKSNASFIWPVKGPIACRFGEKSNQTSNKGIDIRAAQGKDVVASMPGRVVYSDSYFKGFGQTIVIDHADGYQTVYSYNSEILVKVGDAVRQNQVIARVGQSGRATEPMLHFEIRRNGEPQDPERLLR